MPDEDREKAVETAIHQIEKQFGKGSIMRMGDNPTRLNVEVIPSGPITLDLALGVGGMPRGRIVEIFGPESSGKTTVALHVVAEAQKRGGIAAFIDAEHAFPTEYARNLGVDLDNLLISQPDTGEQAMEIAEALVRSGAIDVIVIDSVAALVPKAELEGEMGDAHVGLQARLMSQALRKLTGATSRSRTCMIFINQLREKVGVMFGNPETTPGGRALKFYASVRLDVRRIEALKEGNTTVGNRTRVKVVKNKVAPPFKEAEFDIIYGQGISLAGALLDLAADQGIVTKMGTWYSYGDLRLGQGRENAREFLRQNPDIYNEIDRKVRVKVGLPASSNSNSNTGGGTEDGGASSAVPATPVGGAAGSPAMSGTASGLGPATAAAEIRARAGVPETPAAGHGPAPEAVQPAVLPLAPADVVPSAGVRGEDSDSAGEAGEEQTEGKAPRRSSAAGRKRAVAGH